MILFFKTLLDETLKALKTLRPWIKENTKLIPGRASKFCPECIETTDSPMEEVQPVEDKTEVEEPETIEAAEPEAEATEAPAEEASSDDAEAAPAEPAEAPSAYNEVPLFADAVASGETAGGDSGGATECKVGDDQDALGRSARAGACCCTHVIFA